jgi:hypothetical protein
MEPIQSGQTVCSYAGEILSADEYAQRKRDLVGGSVDFFNFDLKGPYVVDARHYRNVAAFVNHRCVNANMRAQGVLAEHHDTNLQTIVFVARRHIKAGEVLTVHYGQEGRKMFGGRCLCEDCAEPLESVDNAEVFDHSERPRKRPRHNGSLSPVGDDPASVFAAS